MSGPAAYAAWQTSTATMRAFWLPPFGHGNGLAADGWAPVLDVDARTARRLLGALGARGTAAFSAPTSLRATLGRGAVPWRVWVDVAHYAYAQDVIRLSLSGGGRS